MAPASRFSSRALTSRVAAAKREEGSAAAVLARAANRLLAPVWVRLAARQLRSRIHRARTLREQMEVVYGFSYLRLSLGPWQIGAELAAFLKLVEATASRDDSRDSDGSGRHDRPSHPCGRGGRRRRECGSSTAARRAGIACCRRPRLAAGALSSRRFSRLDTRDLVQGVLDERQPTFSLSMANPPASE